MIFIKRQSSHISFNLTVKSFPVHWLSSVCFDRWSSLLWYVAQWLHNPGLTSGNDRWASIETPEALCCFKHCCASDTDSGEKVILTVYEKVLPGAEGCVQSSFLSVALVLGLQTVRWKQHQQQVWRLATVTALFKHLQIPSVHKAVIYACEPGRNQTEINQLYRAFLQLNQ